VSFGIDLNPTEALGRSRTGLLITLRRNGQPVATPVSIAMHAGAIYFITAATTGKARRLSARADVTIAPCTAKGTPTGPPLSGRAHRLDDADRRRARRLLHPAGPLFWSYLFYRIRGHHMDMYRITLGEPL
jgi:PPOX class probable F420-dependent enzyme